MIDGAVDAEKTLCFTPRFLATTMLKQTWHCSYGLSKKVVDFVELFHLDGLVLGVRSSSSRGIPVEQHDAFLCRADVVGNEGVGVEDLPVEEDALMWLYIRLKHLKYLVDAFVGFYLMIFNIGETLEHLFIYGT